MEKLEDRLLLSVLGVSPNFPRVFFDSTSTLSYNPAAGAFDVVAIPLTLKESSAPPALDIDGPDDNSDANMQLHIRVDNFGALIGGVSGNDLVIQGDVDDGHNEYHGDLLTGEVIQFGYGDPGGTNNAYYDLRFRVTGGAMAGLFAGADLGVTIGSENSSFTGSFATSFSGKAKGYVGPESPAALGDRVWNDQNQNGIQDAGELGIAGVKVNLLPSGGTTPIATTTTGNSGSYSFTNLIPGQYQVQFVNPGGGYLPSPENALGSTAANDSNADATTGKTVVITLGSGQVDNTWDAGFYKVVPTSSASLAGNVYYDANDDGVFQGTELGIGGVTVTLTGTVDLGSVSLTATTSDAGAYSFGDLRPGAYTITETQPSAYLDGKDTIGTPGGATGNDVFTNIVLEANVNGVDNNFGELLPASIGDFVWNDLNANGVQDQGEPGIDGVAVAILYAGPDGIFGNGDDTSTTVTTSGAGLYSYTGAPGSYQVSVQTPAGYVATATGQGTPSTDSNGSPTSTTVPGGGSDQTLDFGFYQPVTIGNFVWNDLNGNGVQDAGEPGIVGVTLSITGATGAGAAVSATTTTDANGLYQFTEAPGAYSVAVTAPAGYVPTATGQGTPATDSNVSPSGTTPTALPGGGSDQTLDFGFYQPKIDIEKYVKAGPAQYGGEGLIPGFWKQCQHFYAWTGYSPITSYYNAPFGVNAPCNPTLLEALNANGGGVNALLRHSTAALLNAANPNISYAYTTSQVIAMVKAAFACGDYESTKNLFAAQNELDADLSNCSGGGTPATGGYGDDADNPTGPLFTAGQPVLFTFVATNPGPVALTNVVVVDDNETASNPADDFHPTPTLQSGFNIGDVNHNGQLDVGEAWIYTATEVATAGQHTDVGTVTAVPVGGSRQVTHWDAANYHVATPTLASLGDFVWHDLYHTSTHLVDGVQDAGEPGIAGVVVNLLSNSGVVLSSTITDSTGFYEFAGLPAGTYSVQVAASNFQSGGVLSGWYATLPNYGNDATDSDGDVTTHRSPAVVLAAGQNNPTIDFGFFQTGIDLVKTGPATAQAGDTITYTFTVTNTGDVVLHGGAQVYDALLVPCGDHMIWSGVIEPGQVVTFTGTYKTTCSGDLVNPANAVGHPVGPYGTLPDVTDSSTWTTRVTCPQLGSLGDFVWNDANGNGLQDTGELGVAGVTVTLINAANQTTVTTKTTDAAGKYLFDSLGAGSYKVKFAAPSGFGFTAKDVGTNNAMDSDVNTTTGVTDVLALAAGQTNLTVDAGLVRQVVRTVSGHKFLDLSGNGLTSDDTPMGGTTINLFMDRNHDGQFTSADSPAVASTVTDSVTGAYSFSGLAVGVYFVQEVVPTGYVRTAPALADYYKADLTTASSAANLDFANFAKCCTCQLTNVYFTVNGGGTTFTDLRGNTNQGDLVQVTFTVTGTSAMTLSLVSYTAPQSYFDANTASQQQVFDIDTGTFAPGTYTLSVELPNSYYQVDFVCGLAIDRLGPANSNIFYSAQSRLISADNDGLTPLRSNPASVAGSVYLDSNNDGIRQTSEQGIGLVVVKLTGLDLQGHSVSMTRLTEPNGNYVFDNLPAGKYTVTETQPSGYLDGKDALGSLGGTLANDVLSNIQLAAGTQAVAYTFGEIKGSTLKGFVYKDCDNDGRKECGEYGIAGVQIKLSGTDDLGKAVSMTTTTDSTGAYSFTNLRCGTYKILEVRTSGTDGKDTVGSLGGTMTNDAFSGIVVTVGVIGVDYNFGERSF